MKKLIAFAIAAIMVLSMIPAMAFTASAKLPATELPDAAEGPWTVYRDAKHYREGAEGFPPAPGYKYTDEGFTTVPADYTNSAVKFNVQTSAPQDITKGFYLQFRVDDFSYMGENGKADEWISISIQDTRGVSVSDDKYAGAWTSLIRGAGNGAADLQSFITVKADDEGKGGQFNFYGGTALTVPMDDNGCEIYTLEVVNNDGTYDIKVNGASALGGADYSKVLASYTDGAYISVSFHSGEMGGTGAMTILKMGTSAGDWYVPEGTDSAEPDAPVPPYGDMRDESEIPENMPALYWNASKTSFKGEPNYDASNMSLLPTGNNTYHCTANQSPCYFSWGIKRDTSYEAADFPIFTMMLKNYWGSNSTIFYCAGDVISATNDCTIAWDQFSENNLAYDAIGDNEDYYTLVVVDMSTQGAKWSGRINSMRPDFTVNLEEADVAEWDIDYMGFFRSIEEAHAYADSYMAVVEEGGIPATPGLEPEVDDTQPEQGENPGETNPEVDTAPATTEPATTEPAATEPAGTTAGTVAGTDAGTGASDGEGCSSVIGATAVVAIMAAAAAAVALKKKD